MVDPSNMLVPGHDAGLYGGRAFIELDKTIDSNPEGVEPISQDLPFGIGPDAPHHVTPCAKGNDIGRDVPGSAEGPTFGLYLDHRNRGFW